MSKEISITRPTIKLEVNCGLVRKAQLRDALNASLWEFDKAISHLIKTDPDFKAAYLPFLKKWSMPERLAIQFVEHVCPGWEVEVVLEG